MKREDSKEDLTVSNEAMEEEIAQFHNWIELVCDPDSTLDPHQIFQEIESRVSGQDNEVPTNTDLQQKSLDFVRNLAKTFVEFTSEPQNGSVRMRGTEDLLFEASFKNGLPHGLVRKMSQDGDLEFAGCFVDGKLHGTCWKTQLGGGFLISSSIDFSGLEMSYMYPDGLTALVGHFQSEKMLKAYSTEVIGMSRACFLSEDGVGDEPLLDGLLPSSSCPCHKLLMIPRFKTVDKKIFYKYDPSDDHQISKDPMLSDPCESHLVRVGPSQVPQAGQGLFAIEDLGPATVVAFYNGIRITEDKNVNDRTEAEAEMDEDDWSCYRLNLTDDIVIDIPKEMADTQNYSASLGHKVSHSFTPNCVFEDFEHPRFGLIKCIVTKIHISSGEELTANYEYKLADAPVWYKKLWAKHQKQIRRLPDWNTALRSQSSRSSMILLNPISLPSSSSTGSSRTISESRTPDTIPEEEESQ